MCKIVFLDIDGTLVDIQRGLYEPSFYTKFAINKLIENGYLVFIASGRSKPSLLKSIVDLNPSGYILSNGAYIELNNKILFEKTIDKKLVLDLINFSQKYDCLFTGELQTCIYSPYNDNRFHNYLDRWHLGFVPTSNDFKNGEFFKCIIEVSNVNIGSLLEKEFEGKLDCRCQTADNTNTTYDINQIGINKGSAVSTIINMLNVDKNDTYCFCDGTNDIELIKACKNSYAMENGDDSVKKLAYGISPSVLDDGVYKTLVKLGMIEEYKPL